MLEKITNKTCVYKIRVNRILYISEEREIYNLYKCLQCKKVDYKLCDKYKPIEKTQIPIRRGILANIR